MPDRSQRAGALRTRRFFTRALLLVAAPLSLVGCASSPRTASDAAPIAVYEGAAGRIALPAGCRLVDEGPPATVSEADLATPDTFRADRARAVQSGANVLVLAETLVSPRSDFDCAAAQPITDCPNTLGGWYRVVPRSYDCDAPARSQLPPVASGALP